MKKSLFLPFVASVMLAAPAAAEPLYTVTALVGIEGTDQFHALSGSFFLSDAKVTYDLYGDGDPAIAENLFEYDLFEFNFSSAILSGSGGAQLWMKQRDYIDRQFLAAFDDLTHASVDGGPTWLQLAAPLDGASPSGFRVESFLLRSNDGGPTYRVRELAASRAVPEPSSMLLLGIGLGGVALRSLWRSRSGR